MSRPWQVLRARLGKLTVGHEFIMFLEDQAGIAAWSVNASRVGATFYPDNQGDPGVAWDLPVAVTRMARGLTLAKKLRRRMKAGSQSSSMLDRVICDLESYRDVGCSSTSPQLGLVPCYPLADVLSPATGAALQPFMRETFSEMWAHIGFLDFDRRMHLKGLLAEEGGSYDGRIIEITLYAKAKALGVTPVMAKPR